MDPFPTIPEQLARYLLARLYRDLPPPSDDRPETRQVRDMLAMAGIARLGPANATEGELAVYAIVCRAHAADCLAAVNECGDDVRRASQCRAQSALMMRQAAQAVRELRSMQRERETLLYLRDLDREAEAQQAEHTALRPLAEPASAGVPTGADREEEPAMAVVPTGGDREEEPAPPAPGTIPVAASRKLGGLSRKRDQNPSVRYHETGSGIPRNGARLERALPANPGLILPLMAGAVAAAWPPADPGRSPAG